jgi:hypothetical protein
MSDASKTSYARAFVRSLNTLLKYTRLNGFDHVRSKAQLDIAWHELRSAVLADSKNGVLLSAIGTKLLLVLCPGNTVYKFHPLCCGASAQSHLLRLSGIYGTPH